jgi:hypothetical protein
MLYSRFIFGALSEKADNSFHYFRLGLGFGLWATW